MNSVVPPSFGAVYTLLNALPTDLRCGDALILELVVQNTGYTPWLTSGPYPVRLGYRWLNQQGGTVVLDGGRTLLPAPVPTGMSVQVEVRVEAPPVPGTYLLQVELLEEGQAWFSQRGVAPLSLEVSFAPADALRVAILNGNVVAKDAVGSHIVAQLCTLREAGYHVLLLTGYVDGRLPTDVRRSMAMVSPEQLRDPANRSAAAEHWRRADLVIVNYSSYYDLVEVIRDVRRGVVIFDYHGVTPPELWGREWLGYADLVRGRDNLELVRYADYAIGHSQFTCDELIATKLIAPSRVTLMPYAVVQTSGYAGPPDPEVVERFGLAGSHVLLYVGRMARNKRVHDLVEAMPAILQQHPATLLLLVGDDQAPAYKAYADELRQRIAELDITDHVQLTGQVDGATLEELYRACTIFVTASIHEGFCMPVVEAMARGRPVVATDCTAIPHTLDGSGLLFPPGDVVALVAQVRRLLDGLPTPGDHHDPMAVHRLEPATAAELTALRERKIAVVTPRYGEQVLGGAETGLRHWAEQLAARGYQVEALSTTVLDMGAWQDHVPPGEELLNGVQVRRFSPDRVDVGLFHQLMQQANRGERLSYADEQRFMVNNLRSSALEQYIADHADEFACFIYAPYLFGTTYWPAQNLTEKAFIVPCLHDEPSARLVLFREMLERSAAIFFNAEPEGVFARACLGVQNPYHVALGFGFPDDPPIGDVERFRTQYTLNEPFLLYSGRLEQAKNVPLLLEYFTRYKAERPGPLKLALTGHGDVQLPAHPDVVALGMVEHQTLVDAYAACLALCQLSCNESFSLVLMESWLQERPVLVHTGSAVTSHHVIQSGGGYALGSYEEFRTAVDTLLTQPEHADMLGVCGREYVQATYSWGPLLNKLEAQLAIFSRPRSCYSRLAQRGVARALAFTEQRFADVLLDLVTRSIVSLPSMLGSPQQTTLHSEARVARPDYHVCSNLPVVGPAVAWVRRQLTSHLKEPYLDPVIADQERFNQALLTTLLPTLDESMREQRRLQAELDLLRAQLEALQRSDT
ncbi:glycosyltransferase [Candidatus Viridilinea mediisalina]|uniref:Glycosyl transferase n=1 Tax=Candidatus Viridilinea mediisalina TaxID=2024553 RepID=A0A2A6RMA8_9CHLR|nr:glycosyltransferase [Candidatus Viridilinea mediisalina]PDW04065.1 glycosyl transferase [Candidatus Viridilinea mediisalina]